jgi:hypothetical protein
MVSGQVRHRMPRIRDDDFSSGRLYKVMGGSLRGWQNKIECIRLCPMSVNPSRGADPEIATMIFEQRINRRLRQAKPTLESLPSLVSKNRQAAAPTGPNGPVAALHEYEHRSRQPAIRSYFAISHAPNTGRVQ